MPEQEQASCVIWRARQLLLLLEEARKLSEVDLIYFDRVVHLHAVTG
jgi:hypothetical protein